MGSTPTFPFPILFLVVILVFLPTRTYAFGAGDIPDFAYLNDKAFRHGDIENILENLVKSVGGAAVGLGSGGLLGIAKSVLHQASGGSKFSKSDIKKVYFGNWLRDYSQAMDIGGLSKLSADTLVLIVRVLGFMTFGFATEEFEVTPERLGVYLPVEHIDNPKGYAEKEGDARTYHPKLRPPVNPRELEIDERTGMKKYMATENQGWDTSTALIRRTFRACIEMGRHANGQEGAHLWEAYRLLGTGLHTMEDLLAHSNWCEIALRKMGYEEVFCHVGDRVLVNTPNGPSPPLVTGTFGGADFLHSLIGEAGDKLSQASVTDLSQKMNQASNDTTASSNISALKNLLGQFSLGGDDNKLNETEQIHQQSKAYRFNPDNVAPPEVQKQLIELLKWRDGVMREILEKIEMIPGLSDLIEQVTNALNAYVYTILAPYVGPMLSQATGVLDEGSKAVINNEDQYEVFDNPRASDPSHSLLSKDHFGLILNEPAGKIAQIVVEHSVNLIVHAWADNSNPDRVIDKILEAFHHPYYATGRSQIQNDMFECMEKWIGGLGPEDARKVIEALTKESVRNHKNKRLGSEDQDWSEPGYGGHSHSHKTSSVVYGGKPQNQQLGYGGSQSYEQQSYSSGGGYDSTRRSTENEELRSGGGGYRSSYNTSSSQGGYSNRRSDNQYGRGDRKNDPDDRHGDYGSRRADNVRNDYQSGSDVYSSSAGYGSKQEYHRPAVEETSYAYRQQTSHHTSSYESTSSLAANDHYTTSRREDRYGVGDGSDAYGSSRQHEQEETSYQQHQQQPRSTRHTSRDNDAYTRRDDYDSYGGGGNAGRARMQEGYGDYSGGSGTQSYDTGDSYGSRGYNNRDSENYGAIQSLSSNREDHTGRQHHTGRDNEYHGGGRAYEDRNDSYSSRREDASYGQDGQSGQGASYGRQATYESDSYERGRRSDQDYGGNITGYSGREDAFGVERLRVNDDEGEGNYHHEHHSRGRGHRHQEETYNRDRY